MKDRSAVIGIDIGGTKISAALFSASGDILKKKIQIVSKQKGEQVIDSIGTMAISLIKYSAKKSFKVHAIGACVPGIYNSVNKTVWAPNIPDWDNIPLWDELTRYVNDPSIKIVIESDRSCYILGEIWKGSAKGCSDAIFVAVGTGIGAGILSNGKIINGASGISGAIGWLALEPPYRTKYKPWGNFEHYASGNGIARSAVETLSKDRETISLLDEIPFDAITAYDIFHAYDKQDSVAIEVIDKAILYWGMVVANLVSIFNPQKVIFGGGIFGPGSMFLSRILKEAKKWAQPLAIKEMTVEASKLNGDAGVIGAGYLAIRTLNVQSHGE